MEKVSVILIIIQTTNTVQQSLSEMLNEIHEHIHTYMYIVIIASISRLSPLRLRTTSLQGVKGHTTILCTREGESLEIEAT